MAKPLSPIEKKQLSAFVEIIPNPDVSLVQEALESGYYRGVSLLDAQKTLLNHEGFNEFKEDFVTSSTYNRERFEQFLNKVKTDPRGLYERIKRAVWNNDLDILDPNKASNVNIRSETGELVPPRPVAVQPPPSQPPPQQPTEPTGSSTEPTRHEQPQEPEPREEVEAKEKERSKKPEQIQQPQEQHQQGSSGKPRPANALPEKRNVPISSKTRKLSQRALENKQGGRSAPTLLRTPSLSGSRGLFGTLNNYLVLRDLAKLGQWAANKLGLNGLGNLIKKIFAPEKWLGQLARGAMNLASSLVRAALQGLARAAASLLPRLVFQVALATGRSLLMGAVAGIAAVGLGPILVALVISSLVIFSIWWIYDQSSECGQPGTMTVLKTAQKNGSPIYDRQTQGFEAGEEIEFVITTIYKVKCAAETVDLQVRDIIPTNSKYVEGSDTSKVSRLGGFYYSQADGPKATVAGSTLVWEVKGLPANEQSVFSFKVMPTQNDVWIANEATVNYTARRAGTASGSRIIDSSSRSFEETAIQAAQIAGMEPALLKAFLKVEAGQVLGYSEEEFNFFSTPGWWLGLVSEAPTREENDPLVKRGYAYNTCAYVRCAPGADVRGVAQFEIKTWNGIVPKLKFEDRHEPDRRIARDAIYGSAILNQQNAETYVGSPNIVWTEDVIKATGRMYCGGVSAAKLSRITDPACVQNGISYDDLLWQYYLEFSGRQ